VSPTIEGLDLPRLRCRRPLTRRLGEFGRLSLRRFSHMLLRDGAAGFDVTSCHDVRSAAAELLDRFSTLSGQVHALSDDPWWLMWGPDRRDLPAIPGADFNADPGAYPVRAAGKRDRSRPLLQAYAAARGKHAVLLAWAARSLRCCPRTASSQSGWAPRRSMIRGRRTPADRPARRSGRPATTRANTAGSPGKSIHFEMPTPERALKT